MSKILFHTLVSHLQSDLLKNDGLKHLLSVLDYGPYDPIRAYEIAGKDDKITPHDLAAYRLYHELGKKYIGESNDNDVNSRKRACWDKFTHANSLCAAQNEMFFSELEGDLEYVLEFAARHLERGFWRALESEESPFLLDEANKLWPIGGFSTGPGSCTGVKGTSTYEKYRNEWLFSSEIGVDYLRSLRKFMKPLHDLPNYSAEVRDTTIMSEVPKDRDIFRGIIPQLNGDLYLQYPMMMFMELMLRLNSDIRLDACEPIHHEMARKGSLHDNRDIFEHSLLRRGLRPCTIDLVSASDVVGIMLNRFLFVAPMFDYMLATRSPKAILGSDEVVLQMMANMGNAFCFPMQTLVFDAIIRAVYWRLGLPTKVKGEPTYSVYGDDIIVDVTAYDEVIRVLGQLKMVPNKKKSFGQGFFRESCGADFFRGVNIRPVYCETLDCDADIYSLANRLIEWTIKHPYKLISSVGYLLENIEERCVTPMHFGDHTGLNVPECVLPLLPPRWSTVRTFVSSDPNIVQQEVVNKNTCLPPDPFWFLPERKTTIYTYFAFSYIEIKGRRKLLNVGSKEKSLFPYLRGGINLVKDNNRALSVPTRGTEALRVQQYISLWDVPDPKDQFYVEYYQESIDYYGYILRDYLSNM